MKRKTAFAILNFAAALVIVGGCFDMLMPSLPSNLLAYLEVTKADMSPRLATLLFGIFRALGGCLLAIGITALVIINGPIKRGERWASRALLLLVGISKGINASQMWRFGSPYYAPLSYIALIVLGLMILPKPAERSLERSAAEP